MTWEELKAAKLKLGLTGAQMAQLLGVSESTYKGWGTRGKVPAYIAASVAAHLRLNSKQ
jgi:DNA-binding transcriptional regulator YiaG